MINEIATLNKSSLEIFFTGEYSFWVFDETTLYNYSLGTLSPSAQKIQRAGVDFSHKILADFSTDSNKEFQVNMLMNKSVSTDKFVLIAVPN